MLSPVRRSTPVSMLTLTVLLLTGLAAGVGAQSDEAQAPYRILVTNDDGIESPGLLALVEALAPLGELVIVAPLDNQSGIGHAINLRDPIFVRRLEVGGHPATGLSGTPATAVRVALSHLLQDSLPDLVVAGVNRGLNFGRNTYVSGTVGAAREAALQGVPAIATSLAIEAVPHYGAAAAATAEVVAIVREQGLPPGVFLNVNTPATAAKGIKVVRQSELAGSETFEAREKPNGRPYLWSIFTQPTGDPESDTDIAAVLDGYVAVTPLRASESADDLLDSWAGFFPGDG